MKTFITSIFIYTATLLLFSCANNDYLEQNIDENIINTTEILTPIMEEKVIPAIDTNTYIPMLKLSAASYDPSGINFFYLKNVPFTIKNKHNGKYLYAQGKGKKMAFSTNSTNDQAKFKVEYDGVYRIRSEKYGVLITRGHEEKHEDTQILILPEADDPSYASKWYVNSAIPQGYFTITNTSYLEPTPNGMVYYSLKAVKETDVQFGIYSEANAMQEFEFTPLTNFNLTKITYRPQNTRIRQLTPKTVTVGKTNNSTSSMPYTFNLVENVTEKSQFDETKHINFNVTNRGQIAFQRPGITNGSVDVIPDQDSPANAIYQNNVQYIQTTLRANYPVNIPAKTKLNLIYSWNVYELEVEYIADIVTDNNITCSLVGIWKGTMYVDDIPLEDQDWEVIDLNTQSSRKVKASEIINNKL